MRNFNLCDTKGCGDVFFTYYCKKCGLYQDDYCKRCHEEHFDQVRRMKDLSRLKRGLNV